MEETFSFLEENDSINNTKIIKEKSLFFTNINCIEIIKCNNKDYFVIGVSDSDSKSVIEIYDFFNFEKIGSSELDYRKIINIKQIFSHYLLVSTGKYLRIFAFNLEFDIFQIILIQQIEIQFHNEIFKWFSNFLKPFIFDINLFREKGNVLPKEYKLIANTTSGIYLYTKKIKKENDKYTQYNIYESLDIWNKNPFIYKGKIIDGSHYNVIQVNYEYIATLNTKGCLSLYSMTTNEIVTIFEVNNPTVENYICMLTKDILCVVGGDTLSLLSIKDFEIVYMSVIKPKFSIIGICILNDNNILIALNEDNEKHLMHYKYNSEKDILSKKINHNITQISSEIISSKKGNLKMISVDKNKFITIIGEHTIQLREINNSNF